MKSLTGLVSALLFGALVAHPPVAARADVPAPGTNSSPAMPYQQLGSFAFTTNWLTSAGFTPLACSNVASVASWLVSGDAVLVATNLPAALQYRCVESDGVTTNLVCNLGAVVWWFSPAWASTDQSGTGPGSAGRFLEVGVWTTNASLDWWAIGLSAQGTSLWFSASSGGVQSNYAAAAVSWASNSWHQVAVEYSATNSWIFLDGQLAAAGAGVTLVPGTNALANGLAIGSDAAGTGLQQAGGQIAGLTTWTGLLDADFINSLYLSGSNSIAAWGGLTQQLDLQPTGGVSEPVPVTYSGPAVYLTNVAASGQTVSFQIAGGATGVVYWVFATVAGLRPGQISAAQWQWVAGGYTGNTITLTNQTTEATFYVLGTPQDSTGCGLDDAYLRLVEGQTGTLTFEVPSVDGLAPDAWYLAHGLNPNTQATLNPDADLDGLLNWQEYRWGSDPLTKDALTIWTGVASSPCGLP